MQKVLSVSVAAYNVENFIVQCLDSFVDTEILDQIEVLVTDDGSTDSTREIVKKYQEQYPQTFHLICQKNAGPGSTVNSGLAHACGKYFRMVDGDDWVQTENLKEYISFLQNHDVDMVCTNYCCVDHVSGEKQERRVEGKPWGKILPWKEACCDLHLDMHHVTYRTDLLREHQVRLDHGFYTDLEYLLLPVPYVQTVAFLNLTIYMYRVSLSTQSMNMKSLQKNVAMHEKVLSRLLEEYRTHSWDSRVGSYMLRRIAIMEGMQLSIYLSFTDVGTYREKTKQMLQEARNTSEDLYQMLEKVRTFRLLIWSRFTLYSILSWLHRKRLGVS